MPHVEGKHVLDGKHYRWGGIDVIYLKKNGIQKKKKKAARKEGTMFCWDTPTVSIYTEHLVQKKLPTQKS